MSRQNFINSQKNLSEFLKSQDFSRALLLGIALTIPIIIGIKLDLLAMGMTITVGALLASPSDTSSSIRDKMTAILLATLLAVLMSLLGRYLMDAGWLLFPILGILMFSVSYISIYGFRASLISFSGLFALVLSFSTMSVELSPLVRALFIGFGGLWYAVLVFIWNTFFHKAPTEYYLSETLKLTAFYLKIRGELAGEKEKRPERMKKLLQVQTELTDLHETLRNILIESRKGSGKSDYAEKRLLIFAVLIDMLELAMTNPVDYSKTDRLFKTHPGFLEDFQSLLFAMSSRLNEIAAHLSSPKKLASQSEVDFFLEKVKEDTVAYSKENGMNETVLMLGNLLKYQKEQAGKIKKIEWLLSNPDRRKITYIRREEAQLFLTKENYAAEILKENFNFKSPVFKHSLRLAVISMIGYGMGMFFDFQNPYWILLTIIVIMRPSFGLTKTRSRERTIGTLIGGAVAVGFVYLIDNTIVFGILAITTLIIAFSMVQQNYRAGATFITLSVVFVYALLTPDIFSVIQFRVLDTLVGAGLATWGNMFLWPAWEIHSLNETLHKTIRANRTYLQEIFDFYKKKGSVSPQYKLSRKAAFLKISELNTAFQRMTQEPKNQQKNIDLIYELVVVNHTLLGSMASFSTFILNHPTTEASENFLLVSQKIIDNLSRAEKILQHIPVEEDNEQAVDAEELIHSIWNLQTSVSEEDFEKLSIEDQIKIEEEYLVREQLKWLLDLSKRIPKLIDKNKLALSPGN